ncbi:hypothetical protein [Pseudokordiimonas caeni]|uniref:hypothetical protein n=1 Tax=Pseudokordiimonas caeni TaxID=2997908 RepID=UPI002812393C|nr:hypothetical protein [Pseudokordiimonas caeni]
MFNPRMIDRPIAVGPYRVVRSLSVAHLQAGNPARLVDRRALAARLAAYRRGQGLLGEIAAWAATPGLEVAPALVQQAIVAGRRYGEAGDAALGALLWQAAALMLVAAGVDHPNDL